jgi:HSP20 family protein
MANIVRRGSGQNVPSYVTGTEWDPFRLMSNLLGWDPFREMTPSTQQTGETGMFLPRFEVKETKDGYLFLADVPGVKENDIDISLTGNRLTISGKREAEEHNEGDRFFAYERAYGTFSRSFTLPEGTDPENVRADLKNGVLQVLLPKKPEMQPRKITLQGGNSGSQQIGTNVNKGQKANA